MTQPGIPTTKEVTSDMHYRMNTNRSHGIGWVAVQLTLILVQVMAVFVRRAQWRGRVSRLVGATLLAAAGALALPGFISLGRNLTPLPEPKADGKLVVSGIYARIRHPIYTSLMAAGLGWALLWRSWPALFLAVVQTLFLREKAKNEEKRLRVRFPDYAVYAHRIPRFLPHLLPGHKYSRIV